MPDFLDPVKLIGYFGPWALVGLLVVVLFATKAMTSDLGMKDPFAWGRALAFLMGAIFSALVGRIATSRPCGLSNFAAASR